MNISTLAKIGYVFEKLPICQHVRKINFNILLWYYANSFFQERLKYPWQAGKMPKNV